MCLVCSELNLPINLNACQVNSPQLFRANVTVKLSEVSFSISVSPLGQFSASWAFFGFCCQYFMISWWSYIDRPSRVCMLNPPSELKAQIVHSESSPVGGRVGVGNRRWRVGCKVSLPRSRCLGSSHNALPPRKRVAWRAQATAANETSVKCDPHV